MPVFRNRTTFELLRGVKAFFNLETGLVRGEVPKPGAQVPKGAPARPANGQAGGARPGVQPESLVWIFGAGRTGSTWLANMINEMPRTSFWNEPMVGRMFGDFYANASPGQRGARNFILGEPAKESWMPLLREFVLGSASYRFPRLGPNGHLVIKEPNGSSGAPLIAEALPESRLIFLIRDPRDVVASVLDGAREGSWLYERKRGRQGLESVADADPDQFVHNRARRYSSHITSARAAFDQHRGPKSFVRYEDLRAHPEETLTRVYADLQIPANEGRLRKAVEKYSWENIPEEEKGEGKKLRKASPGGWSEDLTPKQVRIVERATAPLLEEFYPNGSST